MNPRIENLAAGITREVVSEQTHLLYNPATGAVTVAFQSRASLFQNDVFLSTAGDWYVLQRDLADIATRSFGVGLHDPATGAPLDDVSPAGVALIVKAAFAALYDEAVAAQAVPDQPDEASSQEPEA